MRILVVEDESELAAVLVEALEGERYAVDLATHSAAAEELAEINPYDLVILDWGIPGRPGIDLLREWRQAGLQTPVLMLTGRGQPEDRVGGLDTGADDYLVKPFAFPELLARVRSLLRRRQRSLQSFRAGDLELDASTREVRVASQPVELSPKEFSVLEYLLSRLDEPVTRTELTEHAWDDSFDAMSNVVDVIVHRLRRKIDGDRATRLLHTVKGVGYVLRSSRS
jgi:DNA-binding response OmpR family regulator